MADYDVAAIALASPPTSTPPATYTPAISVRNNGLHDAIATGWLTFYRKSTGVLVAQFNVASGTIHPGATGNATADGTLDLSAEVVGTQFIVSGYVTTTNDQVETNNQLAPVIITVSAEPPPPPPPVAAHASQHEEAGGDEIHVDGLHGKLLEPQEPEAHALEHQVDGDDELDVTGLAGVLAEAQTPKLHANEAHAEAYITAADLPTAGVAVRLLPRVVEIVTAAPNKYTDAGFKPNLAGALSSDVAVLDPPILHSGASHEIATTFGINVADKRQFALRYRCGLKVTGNAALDITADISLDGGGGAIVVAYEDFTLAANSDQDTILIDLLCNVDPAADGESYTLGATGVILYNAGPSTPNQRRIGNWQYQCLFAPETWTASLKVIVRTGDASNGLVWYHGVIEHVPSASE